MREIQKEFLPDLINKNYKYKNYTLIELLKITEYEQTYMITIISKNEYKR